MALPAAAQLETQSGGSDAANGGGFNPGNANFPTNGAVDVNTANTSAPVFSSATYNFVAGDVGHWIFIKSGTNSIPGWYKIASVASNKATLTASIGTAVLYVNGMASIPSTAVGCGTTASALSSLTWGMDYSQTTAARYTYTDLSAGSAGSTLASSGNPFGPNCVGNFLQITGGTNITVGFYELISVAGTSASTDRAVTTGVTSNGAGGTGGALATLAKALSIGVAQNRYFIKNGSYSQAANPTVNAGAVVPDNSTKYNRITGYNTVRCDNPPGANRPTITATSATTTILPIAVTGWIIEYLILDCGTTIANSAITDSASYITVRNCWLKNFKQFGVSITGNIAVVCDNEVSGGTAAATAGINAGSDKISVLRNYVHGNQCTGIVGINGCLYDRNTVYSNTGASSDGIRFDYGSTVINNTVVSNGRDGLRFASVNVISLNVRNNILNLNGGFGMNFASAAQSADLMYDGNFYGHTGQVNTSGDRNNCGTGTLDVFFTGDPYTAKASGDFSLNNTAAAGAAIRGLGIPATLNAGLTATYLDGGAAQHQDAGGGSGGVTRLVGGGLVAT